MSTTTEKRFTEKEAAEFLGISQMTLIRRRNEGAIRYYRVGNRILYGSHHLEEFLAQCECRGVKGKPFHEAYETSN